MKLMHDQKLKKSNTGSDIVSRLIRAYPNDEKSCETLVPLLEFNLSRKTYSGPEPLQI